MQFFASRQLISSARKRYSKAFNSALKELKPTKIRGVPSDSMVCSFKELGISDEHEGIIILEDDAPVGTPLADFMGDIVQAHQQAGWVLHSRVSIWRDPVVEMTRTKALGLLYKQVIKDSSRSRTGLKFTISAPSDSSRRRLSS